MRTSETTRLYDLTLGNLEAAFRRVAMPKAPTTDPLTALHRKGYTLRTAAPYLRVHFGHLHMVLQGKRHSRRLMRAVEALPDLTTTAVRPTKPTPRLYATLPH